MMPLGWILKRLLEAVPPTPTYSPLANLHLLRGMVTRSSEGYTLSIGNYFLKATLDDFGWGDWWVYSNSHPMSILPKKSHGDIVQFMAEIAFDYFEWEWEQKHGQSRNNG